MKDQSRVESGIAVGRLHVTTTNAAMANKARSIFRIFKDSRRAAATGKETENEMQSSGGREQESDQDVDESPAKSDAASIRSSGSNARPLSHPEVRQEVHKFFDLINKIDDGKTDLRQPATTFEDASIHGKQSVESELERAMADRISKQVARPENAEVCPESSMDPISIATRTTSTPFRPSSALSRTTPPSSKAPSPAPTSSSAVSSRQSKPPLGKRSVVSQRVEKKEPSSDFERGDECSMMEYSASNSILDKSSSVGPSTSSSDPKSGSGRNLITQSSATSELPRPPNTQSSSEVETVSISSKEVICSTESSASISKDGSLRPALSHPEQQTEEEVAKASHTNPAEDIGSKSSVETPQESSAEETGNSQFNTFLCGLSLLRSTTEPNFEQQSEAGDINAEWEKKDKIQDTNLDFNHETNAKKETSWNIFGSLGASVCNMLSRIDEPLTIPQPEVSQSRESRYSRESKDSLYQSSGSKRSRSKSPKLGTNSTSMSRSSDILNSSNEIDISAVVDRAKKSYKQKELSTPQMAQSASGSTQGISSEQSDQEEGIEQTDERDVADDHQNDDIAKDNEPEIRDEPTLGLRIVATVEHSIAEQSCSATEQAQLPLQTFSEQIETNNKKELSLNTGDGWSGAASGWRSVSSASERARTMSLFGRAKQLVTPKKNNSPDRQTKLNSHSRSKAFDDDGSALMNPPSKPNDKLKASLYKRAKKLVNAKKILSESRQKQRAHTLSPDQGESENVDGSVMVATADDLDVPTSKKSFIKLDEKPVKPDSNESYMLGYLLGTLATQKDAPNALPMETELIKGFETSQKKRMRTKRRGLNSTAGVDSKRTMEIFSPKSVHSSVSLKHILNSFKKNPNQQSRLARGYLTYVLMQFAARSQMLDQGALQEGFQKRMFEAAGYAKKKSKIAAINQQRRRRAEERLRKAQKAKEEPKNVPYNYVCGPMPCGAIESKDSEVDKLEDKFESLIIAVESSLASLRNESLSFQTSVDCDDDEEDGDDDDLSGDDDDDDGDVGDEDDHDGDTESQSDISYHFTIPSDKGSAQGSLLSDIESWFNFLSSSGDSEDTPSDKSELSDFGPDLSELVLRD